MLPVPDAAVAAQMLDAAQADSATAQVGAAAPVSVAEFPRAASAGGLAVAAGA